MKMFNTTRIGQATKTIAGWLLLVMITENALAQNMETAIVAPFDNYRRNVLQEKIFVHTDKNFFHAGEICWFKIYVTDAFFHRPLDLSKVAYVELLDNANKPVIQSKIGLDKGEGTGSLYMPVTIPSGNYHLRVYSNWMKNFGADYFFQKRISVINTRQVTGLNVDKQPTKYDIQFFPEGGSLVNGISSKVGFRVADQRGKGIDCKGILLNEIEDTAGSFQTLKFGLGNFSFKPEANHRYSAIITMPNGTKVTRDLPIALTRGYVMQLAAENDRQVKVTVQLAGKETTSEPAAVFLFVHTRGSVKAALNTTVQNGTASFLIDKDKLGDGISHFTLFNSEHKPLCERLYFKYPKEKLSLALVADKFDYTTRQKINIRVNAADENNRPVEAAMSMAVYRVDSLQLPSESGIGEYLWLTSDLAGNVESPEYYFNAKGPSVSAAMDNLMLVNGWRRFRWDEVLQDTKPFFKFAPEFNGHIITGTLKHLSTGAPAANIDVYLSAPGTTYFRTSRSDNKGNIKFELRNFYGSPGIVVQTNTTDDSTYRIEINDPFSKEFAARQLPEFLMPVKNPVTLLDQSIGTQVENMYHGDVLNKLDNDLIDTTNFYQRANAIYPLDKYTRFTTMEEVLREYVLPINVRKRNGRYHLPVMNDADEFHALFEKDPFVLVDGVPIFDMDKIIRYDPLKVKKLEAVTRRYYYGKLAFDGIASFVTYNGNLDGFELDPTVTVLDYEALQLHREFYTPVYEPGQEADKHSPDFRNVLNWVPQMRSGSNGIVQNSFYSSDLPGKYVVEIEALGQDGKAGSARLFFEVKKPKN